MDKRHRLFSAMAAVALLTFAAACRDEQYTVLTTGSAAEGPAVVHPLVLDVETIDVPGYAGGMEMVLCQPGRFEMGDGSADAPTHQVQLTHAFYIGKTEVTQGLYQAVMDTNASQFNYGDDYPVDNLSYYDALTFCQRLSAKTGYHFELPTEAQWEYAALGGHRAVRTPYSGGSTIGNVGWWRGNAPHYLVYNSIAHRYDTMHHTQPVAQLHANALGLYDMTGNVREWCIDCWGALDGQDAVDPVCTDGSAERVYRGGSCNDSAQYCTVSHREAITPTSHGFSIGFRVVVNMD